jgi:hypothetical protein
MQKSEYQSGVLLVVIGVSVGWFMGLSVSPVVETVIGVVIASAATLVGTLAGISGKTIAQVPPAYTRTRPDRSPDDRNEVIPEHNGSIERTNRVALNPAPLALLLIGMIVGSWIGVCARTNQWLGPRPQRIASRWSGTGLNEQQIQKRLFDQLYPPSDKSIPEEKKNSGSGEAPRPNPLLGGLFAVSAEDCGLLIDRTGKELKNRLLLLKDPRVQLGVKKCQDDEICLEAVRDVLCSNAK